MSPTTTIKALALLLLGLVACGRSVQYNLLHRYWNAQGVDHFYTNNFGELGTGKGSWTYERVAAVLFTNQEDGTVPLYRYFRSQGTDHFYTINPKEIRTVTKGAYGNHGYRFEGIVGYCYPNRAPGTQPLYRYYKSSGTDHFYTKDASEIGTTTNGQTGKYGYKSEGVECYVY